MTTKPDSHGGTNFASETNSWRHLGNDRRHPDEPPGGRLRRPRATIRLYRLGRLLRRDHAPLSKSCAASAADIAVRLAGQRRSGSSPPDQCGASIKAWAAASLTLLIALWHMATNPIGLRQKPTSEPRSLTKRTEACWHRLVRSPPRRPHRRRPPRRPDEPLAGPNRRCSVELETLWERFLFRLYGGDHDQVGGRQRQHRLRRRRFAVRDGPC